ncbi:MAG: DUF2892 domain-containing protein [Roseiflexaceae bacterium]|nr:DUF2892 domain-containing protein [Roseiflexaceae bacterium]
MTAETHPEYALSHSTATRQNVAENERLISALAGGALTLFGLARRDPGGLALAALGSYGLFRGLSGICPAYNILGIDTTSIQQGVSGVKVEKRITIEKGPEELYRFWRNFENLPQFMKHLESVTVNGERNSHWVAKAPANTTVDWDAEITDDVENERITWRSVEGSQIMNAGEVRFVPGPVGRGTEVHVSLTYAPPAGGLGAVVAKLFGEEPSQQIEGDLRRFKALIETGEMPTVEGQSSGRAKQVEKQRTSLGAETSVIPPTPKKPDQLGPLSSVGKALEDTFPASDPSSVTQTPEDGEGVATDQKEIGLGKKIY